MSEKNYVPKKPERVDAVFFNSYLKRLREFPVGSAKEIDEAVVGDVPYAIFLMLNHLKTGSVSENDPQALKMNALLQESNKIAEKYVEAVREGASRTSPRIVNMIARVKEIAEEALDLFEEKSKSE